MTGLAPDASVAGLVPDADLAGLVPDADLGGLVPVADLTGLVPVADLTTLLPRANVTSRNQGVDAASGATPDGSAGCPGGAPDRAARTGHCAYTVGR